MCQSEKNIKSRPQNQAVQKLNTQPTGQHDHSSSDNEYVFSANTVSSKHPTANIKIQGKEVNVIIDTRATVNLMEEDDFQHIKNQISLSSSMTKIYPYKSKTPLTTLGRFKTDIAANNKFTAAEFHVVTTGGETGGSLLCYKTARDLGLISVVNQVTDKPLSEKLTEEYAELFTGIGKLNGHKVKLRIDESVQPVAKPHRRIPFHVRKQAEKKLEEMEHDDIIEKVDDLTPWVFPIVVALKPKNPNDIRICIDMRQPNVAMKRETHYTYHG